MAEGIELSRFPGARGRTNETVDITEEDRDEEQISLVAKGGYPVRDHLENEDMALPAAPPRAYLRKCDDDLVPVEGVEMI